MTEISITEFVRESGLAETQGAALIHTFTPLFLEAQKLVAEAQAISVTDATQVTEIRAARDLRLKLRRVRLDIEKAHGAAKDGFLRGGRAIDKIKRVGLEMCEPEEKRLQASEDFAVRAEAERKARVRKNREEQVRPYSDPVFYDLGAMSETMFITLLEGFKAAAQDKLEADLKAREDASKAAEEDRKAQAARLEEEARIRGENERLRLEAVKAEEERKATEAKAEAVRLELEAERRREKEAYDAHILEEKRKANAIIDAERKARDAERAAAEKARADAEARLRKERQDAEAKAKADRDAERAVAKKREDDERKAREQAQAELKRQRDEEAARVQAQEAAKRKAAAAPDKQKLRALYASIRESQLPEMATPEGARAMGVISKHIGLLLETIEAEATKL